MHTFHGIEVLYDSCNYNWGNGSKQSIVQIDIASYDCASQYLGNALVYSGLQPPGYMIKGTIDKLHSSEPTV